MLIYKLVLTIISYYYGSEWDPRFAWLQTFFEISFFVFSSKNKLNRFETTRE